MSERFVTASEPEGMDRLELLSLVEHLSQQLEQVTTEKIQLQAILRNVDADERKSHEELCALKKRFADLQAQYDKAGERHESFDERLVTAVDEMSRALGYVSLRLQGLRAEVTES